MARKPLVSVLMSAYNDAAFLPAAIESILGQTLADFEFIILDDGSSDGSTEILRSQTDPRIKASFSKRNWGLSASLNRGLRHLPRPIHGKD